MGMCYFPKQTFMVTFTHAIFFPPHCLQASVPPNVELLPPAQFQYAESFGVIPEPFTSRSTQEQQVGIYSTVYLSCSICQNSA